MPWKVELGHGCPASKPYAVVKQSDGKVEGCHATKADANKQLAALYANEKGAEPMVTDAQRERSRARYKQLLQAARHLSNSQVDGEGAERSRHQQRRSKLVGQLHELASEADRFAAGLGGSERGQVLDEVLAAAGAAFSRGDRAAGVRTVTSATMLIDEVLREDDCVDCGDPRSEEEHLEERAVDTAPWDGDKAMASCSAKASPGPCYSAICAGRKAGDAGNRASYALPHHRTPGGPPNADGVRNALSRLPQTQGLTNRAAAQAHLDAHMKAVQAASGSKSADPQGHEHALEHPTFGYRSMNVELRQRDAGEGLPAKPVIYGEFAKFNEWAEINDLFEGNFMEQVAPGAFKRTFEEDRANIRLLFQHGRDAMMGSKPMGVIETLEESKTGAAYEAPLFRGIPELIMEGLDNGQYGASWRFSVESDQWVDHPKPSDHNPRALPERTLLEVRVAEFGPVTFPAYTSATAALRSRSLTSEFVGVTARPSTGSAGGGNGTSERAGASAAKARQALTALELVKAPPVER